MDDNDKKRASDAPLDHSSSGKEDTNSVPSNDEAPADTDPSFSKDDEDQDDDEQDEGSESLMDDDDDDDEENDDAENENNDSGQREEGVDSPTPPSTMKDDEQDNDDVDNHQEEDEGEQEDDISGRDESMGEDDNDEEQHMEEPDEAKTLSPPRLDKENEESNNNMGLTHRDDQKEGSKESSSLKHPGADPSSETTKQGRKKLSKEEEQARKNRRQKRRAERHRRKLLQDCISVEIPLDFTADLGIAVRHTRKKRIAAIFQAFPQLRPAKQGEGNKKANSDSKKDQADDAEESGKDDTGGETTGDEATGKKKPLDSIASNRNNYSSIIDYLEAKYVKGVMIDDEDGGGDRKQDDDEKGSVYSESSFLDDTDLQRDVAEQVLANSTTTKMELEDDNEFFVNVGNLEVEETELTKEQYDPLKDVDPSKLKKKKAASSVNKDGAVRKKPGPKPGTKRPNPVVTKKAPAPTAAAAKKPTTAAKPKPPSSPKKKAPTPTTTAGVKKKAPPSTSSVGSGAPPKKKAKTAHDASGVDSNNKSTSSTKSKAAPTTAKKKAEIKKLIKAEADRKAVMEKTYRILVGMISQEDLPRRKTKDKVALTCPAEKKPGDPILFENPHVKGQRLKVKIPKNTKPGDTFRVTVPVPREDEGDSPPDHNKWTRDFYEVLSDYAYHFDAWIDSVSERHTAQGQEYPGHFEKRKKFDKLTGEFPKDLKTPIDKAYLQKILRRARQNKHKRDKTAQRLKQEEEEQQKARAIKKEAPEKVPSSSAASTKTAQQPQPKRLVTLPVFGTSFEEQEWNHSAFLI